MNLILFGFKGSGKTYLGHRLAQKVSRPFIDTDESIAVLYGQKLSSRAIYETIGKEKFRVLEKMAIANLASVHDSIIAVGGGAVCDPDSAFLLQQIGHLVHLQASLKTIQHRKTALCFGSVDQLYHERKAIYESLAASSVNVDRSEGEILHELFLIWENLHGF